MGGPLSDPVETPPEGLVATGKLLYQEVGCVACHGPREMDAEPTLFEYVPLGPLAAKTTLAALADYLEDPLQIWPSGQMPSMLLTEPESQAIAAYLIASDLAERAADSTPTRAEVTPDAQAVARGRSLFAEVGCANCHRLGPDRSPIDPALVAAPMERLNGTASGGCLGSSPAAGVPRFALNDAQRRSLLAFLRQLPERRSADVPHELVASAMTRLRCTACHVYHHEAGPEPAVATYFRTIGEADLGDEGRLPPNLTSVGARLNPRWLTQVLEERARVRPYLSARMPEYGSAVALLGSALTAVAGVDHQPDEGPPFQLEAARVGRELVGATAMNCIQCHTISGRDSTGTPGPDLAKTVERLRFDHFSRWLHDPSLIRPGTRMPSFFIAGRSAFTQFLGGRAEDQIRAIWSYLSQGELLPLPDGLIDPGGLILKVTDEPVVFRTFMEAAGVRAIACGFPEQVHCAFDADACRVTLVWTGPFLSAQGAWAARGGSETNPEQPRWKAHDAPLFRPIQRDAPFEPAFEGYQLDGEGRPVFRYRLRGGPTELFVTEQPLPKREQQHASLVSRLTVSGAPGDRVLVDAGDLPFRLIRGEAAAQDDGLVLLTLDPQGEASFDLEVTW